MIRSAENSLSWLIPQCTPPMRIGCRRMCRWWRIIWVICCRGTVVFPIVMGIGLPWMPMCGMMVRTSLEREVMINFYRYGRLRLIITWWSILKGNRIGLMICGWKCPMGIKGICWTGSRLWRLFRKNRIMIITGSMFRRSLLIRIQIWSGKRRVHWMWEWNFPCFSVGWWS